MDKNKTPDFHTENTPLNEFSGAHDEIVRNFQKLLSLSSLPDSQTDQSKVRGISENLMTFFQDVVLPHHSEEEEVLFKAVMECASQGNQAKLAREYTKRLTEEHRDLESMWQHIEADIEKLSKGEPSELDGNIANKLATQYLAHAAFEEHYFLPLASRVLSNTEKAALGQTLHKKFDQ
jgi:hemerythrin-like domain-containing protein